MWAPANLWGPGGGFMTWVRAQPFEDALFTIEEQIPVYQKKWEVDLGMKEWVRSDYRDLDKGMWAPANLWGPGVGYMVCAIHVEDESEDRL